VLQEEQGLSFLSGRQWPEIHLFLNSLRSYLTTNINVVI
jgi:hypothetical protein